MATTSWERSIATAPWFQKPEPSRPVASSDWEVIATAIVARPTDNPNWFYTVAVTASVDDDVEGELRVRTSEGNVSLSARIVSYVGPVLMGWTQVTDWSADFEISIFLEGRRTQSAGGGGGGVRVHKVGNVSLESVPSTGTAIIYPPGYGSTFRAWPARSCCSTSSTPKTRTAILFTTSTRPHMSRFESLTMAVRTGRRLS